MDIHYSSKISNEQWALNIMMKMKHMQIENWILGCLLFVTILNIWFCCSAFFVLGPWWLFRFFFCSLLLCIAIVYIAQIVILTLSYSSKARLTWEECSNFLDLTSWVDVKVLNAIADKMIMKTNMAHERENQNEFKSKLYFPLLFFIRVCYVRNLLKRNCRLKPLNSIKQL